MALLGTDAAFASEHFGVSAVCLVMAANTQSLLSYGPELDLPFLATIMALPEALRLLSTFAG